MAKLNMVKVSTLIREGYVLAVVLMAANMFVVNEIKASETGANEQKKEETEENKKKITLEIKDLTEQENNEEKNKKGKISGPQSFFNFLLSHENAINLIGGAAFSVANNYLKLWDYNQGIYCNIRIGCLGWRSKRLLDIFQFEVNLNLGRGISWSILHIINLIMTKGSEKGKKDGDFSWFTFFFKDILRGFTSMPLTLHISNFSISISLDSMIWAVIGKILEPKDKKKLEEIKNNEGGEIKNPDPNIINDPNNHKEPFVNNEEKSDEKNDNKKHIISEKKINEDPNIKDPDTKEKKKKEVKNIPIINDNMKNDLTNNNKEEDKK